MSRDQDLSAFEDDERSTTRMLQGLISPAPAQALVVPPPDRPAWSGPGESTPVTGSLAAPPSQATPKISPAPMSSSLEGSFSQKQSGEQFKEPSGLSARAKIRRGLGGYFSVSNGVSKTNHRIAVPQSGRLDTNGQPQPIGSRDAQSGRVVTQPTKNPVVNQALATDAMRFYRSGLQSAIEHITGAKLAASRAAKNPTRLAEKIAFEGQPAQTVSDYGAAQIAVDSPQAKEAVVAAVRKRFPVLHEMDNFAKGDPEYGYRSYSMQVQMPNSASEELQIVPKEVFEANRSEHKNYKKARNAQLDGRNAEDLRAEARAQNDRAMAKFDSRNGVTTPRLSKGSAVALPDGSRGIVSYLDSNMKIARVRTESGRNVTVRQGQLRVESKPD
jgi:hypothetical protein